MEHPPLPPRDPVAEDEYLTYWERSDDGEGLVEVITLADYPLPIFDEDLEAASGMPEPAREFKAKLVAADGYLIATPEYNSAISGALKNAIDWASRTESDDEKPLLAYKGKVAGLLAASPGALGGLRGLPVTRSILSNLQVLVVPEQFALSRAHQAFAEDGSLLDENASHLAREVGASVARLAQKIRS